MLHHLQKQRHICRQLAPIAKAGFEAFPPTL